MNRNTESHFLTNPQVNIRRSTFDRSSDHKFTGNIGQLIPFYLDEVLPGDTFKVKTSKVVRLQNLLSPIMDNLYMDTYWFFVPNRLVWDHWREFMGENTSSAWVPQVEYQVPMVSGLGVPEPIDGYSGKLYDYLGVPPDAFESSLRVSALPFRGYHLIWNEFFRDQNLQAPVEIYKGDSSKVIGVAPDPTNPATSVQTSEFAFLRNACKFHDQFTSALPAPQKGAAVDIGLSGFAPVMPRQEFVPNIFTEGYFGGSWSDGSAIADTYFTFPKDGVSLNGVPFSYNASSGALEADQENNVYRDQASGDTVGSFSLLRSDGFNPVNLFADLSGASSVTINQLRLAFQTQRLLENDARGGTRYIELLKSHFGVTSPDARLQRPEYLGGNRIPLNVQTVVQTNGTTPNQPQQVTSPAAPGFGGVGQVGAMSHTVDVDDSFIHSFVEHGYVFGLCVVRYEHNYSQGVDRHWSRRDRLDYYWPEFSNIGEQPIRNKEIYATGNNDDQDDGVFGYNEAWYEYRMKASRMSGQMRKGNGFDFWTIQDNYESLPYLSSGWIEEDKSNVDEVLRVKSSIADQFFADFYIKNETTRPMPLFSVPGLIDHL